MFTSHILGRMIPSLFLALALTGLCACGDDGDDNDDSDRDDAGGPDGSAAHDVHPTECIPDVSATDNSRLQCQGITFDLSVSKECARGGCGLIFDVHGWTMSAQDQNANTDLARLGRENDFIVVQPSANEAPDGRPSWYEDLLGGDGGNHAIVFDFMEQTMEAFDVDPDRVHFTGFSQGGRMTWYFVCNHPDLIASAAPIASNALPAEDCFGQGRANPDIPLLYCQGRKDKLVPFESAQTMVQEILAGMGQGVSEQVLGQDAKHKWTRYSNQQGRLFEFIEHDYTGFEFVGGHCFPGSYGKEGDPAYTVYGCYDQDYAFRWGDAVIEFFKEHPKK